MTEAGKIAVVAVGGNALILSEDRASIPDQARAAEMTVHHIVNMIENGWNVVLTHGSGPQVGNILRRSEIAAGEVATVPMDYADADIQGAVGYMFQRAFHNEFRHRKIEKQAVTLVTQVRVDYDDPAMANPAKPIGPHLDEATAKARADELGWVVKDDAGRGWRRVVPSPLPREIMEINQIRQLAESGTLVIACGGGGIPVVQDAFGDLRGVEAVVDKDLASSMLAREIDADLLVLSTGVEKVAVDFNTPRQRWLDKMTVSEAKRHMADGQFDPGSMGPKVRSVIDYIEAGGERGVITDPPNMDAAVRGEAGTQIVAG